MVFVISTTLVFIFKKDDSLDVIEDENCECRLGPKESYGHMWNIFKLRPMVTLCFMLFTYYVSENRNLFVTWIMVGAGCFWFDSWHKVCSRLQVGFGPQHGVAHLKMIDAGISRDNLVLLTIPALPLQIILSVVLRNSLVGPRSTHSFIKYYILL